MEFLKNNKNRRCFICDRELLVKEYKNFIIIKNKFPYDEVYDGNTHYMLCPKRHVREAYNLTAEETKEMWDILESKDLQFDQATLNKMEYRSSADHFHWHLLTRKTS